MPAPFQSATGVVASFDDHRGDGAIAVDDGTILPFHCTQIADGSRRIEVGSAVRFTTVAGRAGRWEAGGIEPS